MADGGIFIGIDPGSIVCGYGVLGLEREKTVYITSGEIAIPKSEPLASRLSQLYTGLSEIIERFEPIEAVIEKIFVAKGVKAALHLGHARGVAMLSASMAGIPVFEYGALEIKKSVTGYGRADKNQVQKMVKAILGIRHEISFDTSDALAMAVCHIHSRGRRYI